MNAINLHLGCGKRYIPGFIHVDLADYSHIDYKRDVSDLSNFNDSSVDMIYACHVLEHFKRMEVSDVLREWYRVLKPMGICRIAVPDFDAIIKVYKMYDDLDVIMGLLYGGQDNIYNFHYITFNYNYLNTLLLDVGFKNVCRYDWRSTFHRDFDDFSQAYIPHMDKDNGVLVSLNVEAKK